MKGQNQNSRGSSNPRMGVNGHRRSNSRYNTGNYGNNSSQGQSNNSDESINSDKLLHLVAKSIGKKCIVTVSSGARYQGLLVSADLSSQQGQDVSSPLSIVLQSPQIFSKSLIDEKSNADKSNEIPEKLVIQAKDLMDLEVSNVDLNESAKKDSNPRSVSPTSGSNTASPSTTHESKFKTDTDISGRLQVKERELQRWVPEEDSASFALEDDTFNNSNETWDQFKVNEEKFGVESSYDEHLYTTRINTAAPDYHTKLRKAEKIAKDIENQTTGNRHVLEERGIEVDDSGIDEEDKYSGVDRRGDELMAALRNANISTESTSSNISNAPGKYVPPRQRAAQYHDDPAIISSSAAQPGKNPVENQKNDTETSTNPIVNSMANKPDSIPPKPQVANQHNESFRLNAQSEINSLREFSANFKIPHQMPTDLLPILAKDKLKQDEILKKQKEQQLLKAQRREQKQAELTKSTDSSTDVQAQESGQPQQRKKMDPTRPAFKLNPKAAAFTPSSKHTQLSPNPPKANFHRPPNNSSPRMGNQRPFTSGSGSSVGSNTNSKRHYQISPADFFGGADRIPTKEGQEQKIKDFKFSFNLFITTKKKAAADHTPVNFEKTFYTPPTWNSTIDDTYDKLFPSPNTIRGPGMGLPTSTSMPFMPSPMMGAPSPVMQSGFPGMPGTPTGNKFPLSPQQQQQQQQAAAAMAAHFQQQQFHAAMMYQQQQHQQQQFSGVPPGQPPMPMYGPGGEPPFLPPGGFMMPPGNFNAGGSPVNGNVMMGGSPYNNVSGNQMNANYNNHHQGGSSGGRRYNNHHNQNSQHNHKRGSNA
ncbi:DEHA2G03652p [Debaryomyces hansenii CBS767]|uniref:DEHA2G03652p n=1 Tax=Debaryomyces hansenii (strain ATCC 36239 / CBS 767 / BCRC 21394 / JCM 1990 / NBRC 0083 / IGC 2968) TaxID=284592 RepID=Q6BJB7_DEBHA|nr:DEHA2G03652p [Debaryomyces hansenii CBS767]CAG90156.2 DEHA2G03652p [Debaryomyces hansenii CBS767]|eukprot:XP_461704.2 DEHA2G03652p [Debaryomyces hansenii CBS767]